MKIRLLNKQLKMNDATYAPELEVTVRIPMELTSAGDHTILSAEFYEQVGRNLVELLDK